MAMVPVRKPEQVEIERTIDHQRILLRLRVMPGDGGEQATLQVLRGTALQFHQQQQIDRLGRDALDAAQTLQQRLNEMRDRARGALDFQPTHSEVLPALVKMLAELEAQVKEIEAAYEAGQPSSAAANSPHPPGGAGVRRSAVIPHHWLGGGTCSVVSYQYRKCCKSVVALLART